MTVATSIECPVCAGAVALPVDPLMNELLECEDCSAELEIVQLSPTVQLAEAPMAAEDWGE